MLETFTTTDNCSLVHTITKESENGKEHRGDDKTSRQNGCCGCFSGVGFRGHHHYRDAILLLLIVVLLLLLYAAGMDQISMGIVPMKMTKTKTIMTTITMTKQYHGGRKRFRW
jgi:hypothetical protein